MHHLLRTIGIGLLLILQGCPSEGLSSNISKSKQAEPKELRVSSLDNIEVDMSFTCKHEVFPDPSAESDLIFKYARWLQKNNLRANKGDPTEPLENLERLYRIAAENGHTKAMVNLLNGAIRGDFKVTGEEKLRFSQTLIDNKVASGYYFVAMFLGDVDSPLKRNEYTSMTFYRKAADEGHPGSQEYLGDILGHYTRAPEVAAVMLRCAAEQGRGEAAIMAGLALTHKGKAQEAMEVFQLGTAAGDDLSASYLKDVFGSIQPGEKLTFYGQTPDSERARRYQVISDYLSNWYYYNPTVPEINEIVPLPPAELPPWDGFLQWEKEFNANVPPQKPANSLIAELARKQLLNPTTGRPLPESPNFEGSYSQVIICQSGEACPKTGYWKLAWLPDEGSSQEGIRYFKEGVIMPTHIVDVFRPKPWPFKDERIKQEKSAEWRYIGEA